MAENRTGQTKKAANLFQDLLLSLAAGGRLVFSFEYLGLVGLIIIHLVNTNFYLKSKRTLS